MSETKPARRWNLGIHDAIRLMQPEALEQALEQADPGSKLPGGRTPLTLCAEFPDRDGELAHVLLDAGAPLNDADDRGWTPLRACIEAGNVHMAELLLRRGARPNIADNDGSDALMACCSRRKFTLVETLLTKNANPLAKNFDGLTALLICSQSPAGSGKLRAMELLIGFGADIDARDDAGRSPTMLSAMGGDADAVHLLMAAGATPAPMAGRSLGAAGAARAHGHAALADSIEAQWARLERNRIAQSTGHASVEAPAPPRRL